MDSLRSPDFRRLNAPVPKYLQDGGPIACVPDFLVLEESDAWIVVSKAAPLIAHPSNGKIEPCLLGGVKTLLCYEAVNGMQLSLVNRLDRETSGATLLAKNRKAARVLGCAMQQRLMRKEYLAIVCGHPEWTETACDGPLVRQGEVMESLVWLKQCVHPSGKESRTRFKVVKRFRRDGQAYALVLCMPETGRTHQIRVHLAYLGFPILGDKIYGPSEQCYLDFLRDGWTPALEAQLILPRHALHASFLEFPFEGQRICAHAPLPQDMADFMASCEEES